MRFVLAIATRTECPIGSDISRATRLFGQTARAPRPRLNVLPVPDQTDPELRDRSRKVVIPPSPGVDGLGMSDAQPLGDFGRADEIGRVYTPSHLTRLLVADTVTTRR